MSHKDEQGQILALPTWPAAPTPNLGCLHRQVLRQEPKGTQGMGLSRKLLPPLGGGLVGEVPSISSKASL